MCLDFFCQYIRERERESVINITAYPSLFHTSNRRAISCTWMQHWAGWAMYPTDPERWNWTKSDKNLFNFSYEMKVNVDHSLYLWKTLLTKSAVAGFQLWASSLAAFCLANRRYSLLRHKEVDVCLLVLVLGCQLITCSDTRQGSRSLPSTVSYVLHTQRCCCLVPFRYSVCKDLNGVVRLSGTGWSKFVGKFIFMTRQPGAYILTVTHHFEKLCVTGTGTPTIWSSGLVIYTSSPHLTTCRERKHVKQMADELHITFTSTYHLNKKHMQHSTQIGGDSHIIFV